MKTNKISPDDPRLTAYALNEMEPQERAEFQQLIEDDPEARAAIDSIRMTAQALGAALESESAPAVHRQRPELPTRGKILRFPQLYYMVSGLAAACFALFFVYWQNQQPEPRPRHYVAVPAPRHEPVKSAEKEEPAKEQFVFVARPASVGPGQVSGPIGPDASATMNTAPAGPTNEIPVVAALPTPLEQTPTGPTGEAPVVASLPPPPEQPASPALTLPALNKTTPMDAVANSSAPVRRLDANVGSVVLDPFKVEASENSTLKDNLATGGVSRSWGVVSHLPPSLTERAIGPVDPVVVNGLSAVRYSEPRARLFGGIGYVGDDLRRNLPPSEFNTESYSQVEENPFLTVAHNPLSTFSIDVDTASYANVRRFLAARQRPPRDAVRIEEMVNYFPYHYAAPLPGGAPFAASMEVANAPWAPAHRLVRIGLKGREVSDAARPTANLVFLIDVSGSMDEPNKLPLVKQSLQMLVGKLRPDDRVAIVVYAGASGVALPSTRAAERSTILAAIDELRASGSTNGGAGIQLAYEIAKANFVPGGVNRVILATDGDFNVGTTSEGELIRLVQAKARSGVFLTVLGVGTGNFKDAMLAKLADKGNGNYAYLDTVEEARKALVAQAGGTLVTVAKDVKIQVEFNPARVQSYRLLGYEKRMQRAEDFNNDRVDAGEIGAGHTVTALYEIVPVEGSESGAGSVDPLKYQATKEAGTRVASISDELLTLKIRYKEPTADVSSKVEFPLRDSDRRFEEASTDFKFTAAVAAFGMILRDSPNRGDATLGNVISWARAGLEDDAGGYRSEFVELVRLAGETAP